MSITPIAWPNLSLKGRSSAGPRPVLRPAG